MHAGDECRAMAEMVLSLQVEVDLWLSDTAATSEPQLVESVFNHFAYSDAAKMHMAPRKCNIYAKVLNKHDPW